MSTTYPSPPPGLEFPDSDGQPMAENTRQWEVIATLKGNVEAVAPADAFVAGDHLIYVDPADPTDRQAPDVYVAFGRPRGHRGSYQLWDEGGLFPQVIFEVLGPSNTAKEMADKRAWYFGHGAEEYYEFDPEAGTWLGAVLDPATGDPVPVAEMDGYTSPRLGIRFAFRPMELVVYHPSGERFLSFEELADARAAERARADAAEAEVDRARAENDRLRALLRAAGRDPDAAPPG